jgi:CRISPR-associated endonuclease/helicase Cas3
MEVTVARHFVAQGPDGLSPLQCALLDSPSRVRVAEAPTGAGKSYAFQRVLLAQQARILFIVPTRRLAQNLAGALVQELVEAGWAARRAEGVVALWSSDQTRALQDDGVINVSSYRLRQMQALKPGGRDGEMIVAVPEVVSALLIRRKLHAGSAAMGVFDLLEDFDHIVFDEFHTIEARGFGLAALFARLVTAAREDGLYGYGRAKLSFLSATPLDLLPTLTQAGVPEERVALLTEPLVSQGRALHGDVALALEEAPSLAELLLAHLTDIAAELAAGRQVVAIFDSLADLERALPVLARKLAEGGIDLDRVLVINSVRDSIARGLSDAGMAFGRKRNPHAFDLILATASVEMGVTFRQANCMLMEPGREPMNFLQRYGRAARRGEDGRVILRLDSAKQMRQPWLRTLRAFVDAHDRKRVSIEDLTEVLSQAACSAAGSPLAKGTFGQLSKRANYCAGLYWNVLMEHPSNTRHRRAHLFAHRPDAAKLIYRLEQDLRRLEGRANLASHVQRWLKLLRAQAFDLRTIEPRVRVIDERGQALEYPRVWLQRETTLVPMGDEVQIRGTIDDHWREQPDNDAKRLWVCHFPQTAEVCSLPMDDRLVTAWCRKLEQTDPYGLDWDDEPQALEAAKKLVQLTGLVPGHDPDIPLGAVSGVL